MASPKLPATSEWYPNVTQIWPRGGRLTSHRVLLINLARFGNEVQGLSYN